MGGDIIWEYALVITGFTEFWKRFSVKYNNKWYLKIDKEKRVGFNLRVLVVLMSVIVGIAILLIQQDTEAKNLIITLGVTTLLYEYIYKSVIKNSI